VRKSLERSYDVLFNVLGRTAKTFALKVRHGEKKVSIDVLPTYIEVPIQQLVSKMQRPHVTNFTHPAATIPEPAASSPTNSKNRRKIKCEYTPPDLQTGRCG